MVAVAICLPLPGPASATTEHPTPAVLRVGSWQGMAGQYDSIQAAVRAARPGDWVLVGPGDYKESGSRGSAVPAGVLITTPALHLRGMDRNEVTVDGTRPGAPRCSAHRADQQFASAGHDGIVVAAVSGVSIENLTVCNYLTGSAGAGGKQIWFDGGDVKDGAGIGRYSGSHLTATSTYSRGVSNPRGEYGIYTSNSRGPGSIERAYASNMGGSAFFVGGCPDCDQTLRHVHAQFSALGFSGINSGGRLSIRDSEFDRNKTGAASPQHGSCPAGVTGPLHNRICSLWRDNYFHDNNNPNVPGAGEGLAGTAPVGTGLLFAGSQNVAAYRNRFVDNGSWGIVITDLPDLATPPPALAAHCQGGTWVVRPGLGQLRLCYLPAVGNAVLDNDFTGNGGHGNPTNGDIAIFNLAALNPPGARGNCVSGNTDAAGLSSAPPVVQHLPLYNDCSARPPNAGNPDPLLAAQLNCASGLLVACPALPGLAYPRTTGVVLRPPDPQTTMPDPCAGVPVNPWCPAARR